LIELNFLQFERKMEAVFFVGCASASSTKQPLSWSTQINFDNNFEKLVLFQRTP